MVIVGNLRPWQVGASFQPTSTIHSLRVCVHVCVTVGYCTLKKSESLHGSTSFCLSSQTAVFPLSLFAEVILSLTSHILNLYKQEESFLFGVRLIIGVGSFPVELKHFSPGVFVYTVVKSSCSYSSARLFILLPSQFRSKGMKNVSHR